MADSKTQLRKLNRTIDALEKDLNQKQREVAIAKSKARSAEERGDRHGYDQYVIEAALAEGSVKSISATRIQTITLRNSLETTTRNVGVQRTISQVSASMASSNAHGDKRVAAVTKLVADADRNFANLNDSVEISTAFMQKHVMDPETQKAIAAVQTELELEREVDDMTRDDDVEDDAVSVTTKTTRTLQNRLDAIKHN